MSKFEGRRKYPRRQFVRTIGILSAGVYYISKSCEIGEGGLSFVISGDVALHDEVILSFYIPGKELIVVRAAIRATNKDKTSGGFIIGCHFENLKFEHKRLIRTFVSEKTEMEFFAH